MVKNIPYAVANYEEIVAGDYHFVDKTRFIRELEKFKAPVLLRPRRFGKSLWCSILECYYDINRKEKFDSLFSSTDIGREPTPSRNSQMVMRFDFSKIEVMPNYEALRTKFDNECVNSFSRFLAQHGDKLGLEFDSLPLAGSEALGRILAAAANKRLPPVLIIIDEYDNFTNQLITAKLDSLYFEVTTGDSFLRTFYKVIKAGVGEGSVARVFITGVLPITIDDLTSGFNIAEVITLHEGTLSMMGFTQAEVDSYLDAVFAERGWPTALRGRVGEETRTHYNGYRLLPGASDTLYNSTILNYYLKSMTLSNGRLPTETIDDNIRVDVNWLRRLAGSDDSARAVLETLLFEGELPVDMAMLRSKFNMRQFFESDFLPLSLYYLGMLTFKNRFKLEFPNLTVKTIFTDYFNELERISVSEGYTGMFESFLVERDLCALFSGYWERYVGQIPAQAFDKANENFFRTTFYELCTRYLSHMFAFAIEVNHPSGRGDWEAMGRPGTEFSDSVLLIEFKHFSRKEGEAIEVLAWSEPRNEEVEQVSGYANDIRRKYPEMHVRRHVVYTVACSGFRFFKLDA